MRTRFVYQSQQGFISQVSGMIDIGYTDHHRVSVFVGRLFDEVTRGIGLLFLFARKSLDHPPAIGIQALTRKET